MRPEMEIVMLRLGAIIVSWEDRMTWSILDHKH